jgi:hypothetical protein
MRENAMWPKSMHPSVIQAIQEIDAAVFSGDTFEDPEARAELQAYVERWTRYLAEPVDPVEPES